jgi:hypothetical protein
MAAEPEATSAVGRLRLGAVIAVALGVAFLIWLLAIKGDDGGGGGSTKSGEPVHAASIDELQALPAAVGHDVYWAGPKRNYTYELTKTNDGKIYIRYLPPGVQVNDRRPNFLTVGTYLFPNAFTAARRGSKTGTAFKAKLPDGGIAYTRKKFPKSVFFTYPGSDYMQEVYDRSPKRARSLVTQGQVRPIR